MNAHEKEKILADLDSGRRALVEVLNGVNEETAARIRATGKWSIVECVEHLAVSEDYLFSQILASYSAGAPVVNAKREAPSVERGSDRTRAVPAPDVGKPQSRFSTLTGCGRLIRGYPASTG